MNNQVSSTFFTLVKEQDSKTDRSVQNQAYKAVYARSTMVLYSKKTGTPLAALVFKADDPGCLSLLTGRPPPKNESSDAYFQGMLNMQNQPFTFSIVNLSDEGMINFNILHTPYRVSEVNPGPSFGINEVNELHPNQGYTIPGDQRTNRTLVLQGVTKKDDAPQRAKHGSDRRVPMTVEEGETKEQKEGLYFYLSVVASNNCPSLVNKFKEGTVWKTASHFVRSVKKLSSTDLPLLRRSAALGSRQLESALSFANNVHNPFYPPIYRGTPFQDSLWGSPRDLSSDDGDDDDELVFSSRSNDPPRIKSACAVKSRNGRHSATRSQGPKKQRLEPPMEEERTERANDGEDYSFEKDECDELFEAVDVGKTQAGRIGYGKEVQVHSGFTGVEYAYEYPSSPAVICLSIWEGMKFLPLPDLDGEATQHLTEWEQNEGKKFIETLEKIFKSETCVIDLESPADTVICTCGHQCINQKNTGDLTRCPLCRSSISAFVKVDGF